MGIGLCVKEDDGTWTNIPLGLCLRTGYEDETQNPAYAFLLHGGYNIDMTGPIFGIKKLKIEHNMALDGMVGWYTNEQVNVPWLYDEVEFGEAPVYGEVCKGEGGQLQPRCI